MVSMYFIFDYFRSSHACGARGTVDKRNEVVAYRAYTTSERNQLNMTTFEPSLSSTIFFADSILGDIGVIATFFCSLCTEYFANPLLRPMLRWIRHSRAIIVLLALLQGTSVKY